MSSQQLVATYNLLGAWEGLEPVEHRRPLPLALFQAMVSLALLWGWKRVACVILIAFNGCCRPGEVLRACRGQLVLPEDLGQVDGPIFFRISKPKPGRRGKGRVQRAKISCQLTFSFLSRCLKDCHPDLLIFGGSPSVFRTSFCWHYSSWTSCWWNSTPLQIRAGNS